MVEELSPGKKAWRTRQKHLREGLTRPNVKKIVSEEKLVKALSPGKKAWVTRMRNTFGSPLNLPGLRHAPTNEQGVVFLFGMVCSGLGYVVEAVRTGYPDCVAKRRVNQKRDEWEPVRIEFEYCSSHFRKQRHDLKLCDVIVCWKNDWPECPLDVIELETAIKSISIT